MGDSPYDPPTVPPIRGRSQPHESKSLTDAAPAKEDPAALAKRLAAEAMKKKKAADAAAQKKATDAAELAKQLAAEAKAKAAAAAKPAPKKATPKPAPKAEAQPASSAKKRSLADRAGAPIKRKSKSALEALQAAEADEKKAPPSQKKAYNPAVKKAAAPAPKAEAKSKVVKRQSKPAKPVSKRVDPGRVILDMFVGATVKKATTVSDHNVFATLWKAHGTRAAHEGNLQLMVTASVLQDAANRIPGGKLIAAEVHLEGRKHAVFVDASEGVVLGLATPAAIYLAGT